MESELKPESKPPTHQVSAFAFLKGVEPGNVGAGYYWISDAMWAMFQLSFAIITPALIVGAIAERMKFISVLVFVTLWMFAVYFPFAHMVWSGTGFMSGILNANAGIKAIRDNGKYAEITKKYFDFDVYGVAGQAN